MSRLDITLLMTRATQTTFVRLAGNFRNTRESKGRHAKLDGNVASATLAAPIK